MKKMLFMPILFFTLFCLEFYSRPLHAFQLGIGVYTYYNWRDFAWTDAENLEMEPLLQAGPVLNMTWNHTVSLSVSAIIPTGIRHADFDYKPLVNNYKVHVDNAGIAKSDFDVALSYLVSPGMKIFGGLKLMQTMLYDGADTVYTGVDQTTSAVISNKSEYGTNNIMGGSDDKFYINNLLGGALGINFSLPLYNNLSLVSNVSLLYMFSAIKTTPINNPGSGFGTEGALSQSGSYKSPGANIALGVSYYVESLNTSLNFGGRYQVLYNMYSSGDYKESDKELDETWGITCFAMVFMNLFQDD